VVIQVFPCLYRGVNQAIKHTTGMSKDLVTLLIDKEIIRTDLAKDLFRRTIDKEEVIVEVYDKDAIRNAVQDCGAVDI